MLTWFGAGLVLIGLVLALGGWSGFLGETGKRTTMRWLAMLMIVLGILSLAWAWWRGMRDADAIPTTATFVAQTFPLSDYRLFDLGAADIDGDGFTDLYTSNHSAYQAIFRNRGDGTFDTIEMDTWSLHQDAEFPGLEESDGAPQVSSRGLYIYWQDSQLILRAHEVTAEEAISGSLAFLTPITTTASAAFDVAIQTERPEGEEEDRSSVLFRATGDGILRIAPHPMPRVGSPVFVRLDAGTDHGSVFIGQKAITPSRLDFTLALKDRHGMVWADLSGDGRRDLFVARGANLGLEADLDEMLVADELFIAQESGFERQLAQGWGFEKRNCAARQAGGIDINNDDWLDLYLVCIRDTPNQLYVRQEGQRFQEVAAGANLAIPEAGSFAWLDADGDGDQDMFWAGEKGLALYDNADGIFTVRQELGSGQWVQNIAIADYDRDGDGDIFTSSADGNLLLRNDAGRLAMVKPNQLGLPPTALSAAWVDYDNDGLLDLHVPPSGLYRQDERGHFHAVHAFAIPNLDPRSAVTAWIDVDQDGRRDLLLSLEDQDRQWHSDLYMNRTSPHGHWLTVDVQGATHTPTAIGARVVVGTNSTRQFAQVGWSESSHFSQGHDRVYFGLGSETSVTQLTVTWPDGMQLVLEDLPVDQRLVVSYPPSRE